MILFEFSFSKLLLYPFIAPVFNLVQDLLFPLIGTKGHIFLNSAMYFLGEMLSIIIELIAAQEQKQEEIHSTQKVLVNHKIIIKSFPKLNVLEEKQHYLWLLALISCISEFVFSLIINYFLSNVFVYYKIQLEGKAFPLFAASFMNIFIIKEPFERHHLFAMIIITISAWSIFIMHLITQNIIKSNWEAFIIAFLFMLVKLIGTGKEVLDTYFYRRNMHLPLSCFFIKDFLGLLQI